MPNTELLYLQSSYVRMNLSTDSSFDNQVQDQYRAVPIPAAAWLLGSGLLGLVGIRRKINN